MTQNKQVISETSNSLIEKLEALPRTHMYNHERENGSDEAVSVYVKLSDLRAIIEQEKSKIPEGLKNSQAEQERDKLSTSEQVAWMYESATEISEGVVKNMYGGFKRRLSYNKPKEHPQFRNLVPLYTAPQPTPQDVIDAERWRKLRSLICNGMSGVGVTYFAGTDFHTVEDAEMLDSVIDQAMKAE